MPRVSRRAAASATGEASILDGLGDVRGADIIAGSQIGDGPGDFEDAMPGAGREVELGGGLLQQLVAGRVGLATGIDFLGAQPGIRFLLPGMLAVLGLFDTGANNGRRFAIGLAGQAFGEQGRNFDDEVDAVKEGAGELAAIASNLVGRASAFAFRRSMMPARTWIHGRDELEFSREFGLSGGTGDMDAPGFKRLAQGFQHFSVKFGQLVEEQYALVRQADFARAWRVAAADQRYGRSRVVRLPIGANAEGFRPELPDQ